MIIAALERNESNNQWFSYEIVSNEGVAGWVAMGATRV
jgi:hypothetical protein